MAQEIEVVIEKDGTMKIDAIGFKGKSCSLLDKIVKALGKKKNETLKSEYYEQEVKQQPRVRGF